jgi:hypothetical protein
MYSLGRAELLQGVFGAASTRDERFDFIRGLAMLFVIVNHIHIPSLYQVLTVEAIGVVTGAEMFVVVSGAVLAYIYRRRIERGAFGDCVRPVLRRALTLYLVVVAVNLCVYAFSRLVSSLDHTVLTVYTSGPHRWHLFGDGAPWPRVVAGVMTLRYGTSQVNVLGLYVLLLVSAPIGLWLLYRGKTAMLLALSWGIYVLQHLHPLQLRPLQSELAFPVLTWQLLFIHGMAAGWHRDRLIVAARNLGRATVAALVLLAAAFSFYALNNPWNEIPFGMRFAMIPEHEFGWVYYWFFDRKTLGIGRLINTFLVVGGLYALLTVYWQPLRRWLGGLFVPIGSVTLYVFVVHVIFVLLVANVPALQQQSLLNNTIGHTLVLLTVWAMVKTRFLYAVIPR